MSMATTDALLPERERERFVPGQVHPVYYPSARNKKQTVRPPHFRDGLASREVERALVRRGYDYGESVLNSPPTPPYDESEPLYVLEPDFVTPGDVLLQTTRPPMDDRSEGGRRQIELGGTTLEQKMFEVWRRYLEKSSRKHVTPTRAVRKSMKQEFASRKDMKFFYRKTCAPYYELNAMDGKGWKRTDENATAVFLLRLDQAWHDGPGMVGAFGLDGISTTIWTYVLSRKYDELLDHKGFTLAEMRGPELPERITDLVWCMDWSIEVMAQVNG